MSKRDAFERFIFILNLLILKQRMSHYVRKSLILWKFLQIFPLNINLVSCDLMRMVMEKVYIITYVSYQKLTGKRG